MTLEYNKDFKLNNKQSHNFSKLFDELKNNTKSKLELSFKDLLEKRDMSDVIALEKTTSVTCPRNLKENLENWSDVFVKIRYIYDFSGLNIYTMFAHEIVSCIRKQIFNIKPEWK